MNKYIELDKILKNKKSATVKEIYAELREKLPKIYLSKDALEKLESYGIGRAEILMCHTPNEFVSAASEEVLREFGFLPEFDKPKALKYMTKDYVVKNYAELTENLGAKIDFNYIFSEDLPREITEFYAEQLYGCSKINHDRLVSYLHHRAIFFRANFLMLYGADPEKVMKKLSPEEIQTRFATFRRYGLKSSVIKDRIEKCRKSEEGGTMHYDGRYGTIYAKIPMHLIICSNCLCDYMYHGHYRKYFCCANCGIVFRRKIEAKREIIEEIRAALKGENISEKVIDNITEADLKRFEADTKKSIYQEIIGSMYKNKTVSKERAVGIAKHVNKIFDELYGLEETTYNEKPGKVIIMFREQESRRQTLRNKQN